MVVFSADRLAGCLSKPPKLTMRDGGKSDRTIGEWSADDRVFQRESCGVRHNDPGLPASDYNSPLSQRLFVCIALIAMSKSPITCHGTFPISLSCILLILHQSLTRPLASLLLASEFPSPASAEHCPKTNRPSKPSWPPGRIPCIPD